MGGRRHSGSIKAQTGTASTDAGNTSTFELKELIPMETVIGSRQYRTRKPDGTETVQTFDITYGNLLLPIFKDRGPLSLTKEKYEAALNAFFESNEGKLYRRPNQSEILEAQAMVRDMIENYKSGNASGGNKEITLDNRQSQQASGTKPVIPEVSQASRTETSPQQNAANTSNVNTGNVQPDQSYQNALFEENMRALLEQQKMMEQQRLDILKQQQDLERAKQSLRDEAERIKKEREESATTKDEDEDKKPKRVKFFPIKKKEPDVDDTDEDDEEETETPDVVVTAGASNKLAIVSIVLSFISILLMGFMLYFTMTGKEAPASSENTNGKVSFDGEGVLNVDGVDYTIPISTISVKEGETKTVFYALQTSVGEDGEMDVSAYPIGSWVFGNKGLVEMEKEQAKTEEKEPEVDDQETNTEQTPEEPEEEKEE